MSIEVPTIADFVAARRAGQALNAIGKLSNFDLRERIAQSDNKTIARAELAKVGVKIDDLHLGDFHSDQSRRTLGESKRALNKLLAEALNPALDDEGRKRLGIACDVLADHIEGCNQTRAGDETAELEFARLSGNPPPRSELKDRNGQRIGVMLSNADLRDERVIATKLGVNRQQSNSLIREEENDITLADFFRGVAGMKTPASIRASLTEGTNTAGGYTVPTILLPGILNALVPASSLLNAGANIAMLDDTQAKSFNIAATDTIPTAAWRSENGAVAESDPAFRSITVTPQSLAFLFKVSRELLQDAPGLENALRIAIAQAFAKELDRAGLRGSGTAPEIRGLLNMSGVNAVTSGTNGAVLTDYSPFIKARKAIADQNAPMPNAAIMSTREDETIALFTDTTGQPLRRPDALTDWKFLTTTQLPVNETVGTSTDCSEIYVGNFAGFTYFIREGVSVQLLHELYAATGQVGFVCHTRVDVAAAYTKAFAVITGVRAPA